MLRIPYRQRSRRAPGKPGVLLRVLLIASVFGVLPQAALAEFDANTDNLQINEGVPGSINVFANDTTGDNPMLTAIINIGGVDPCINIGSTSTTDAGDVTYTPNLGASGCQVFRYTGENDASESDSSFLVVGVSPVAGAPLLTAPDASGDEDTAIALSLAAVPDTALDSDGSEMVSAVTISGVPAGASLSAGSGVGGVFTLTVAELSGLTLTPPPGFSGAIGLSMSATVEDTAELFDAVFVRRTITDTATAAAVPFTVTVNPVAEEPTVVANDVTGLEDTAIALDITVTTPETDGSDTITITISSLPDGFIASAGARTGTTVTLTEGEVAGLTITPLAGFSGAIPLTVEATAVDDGATATGSDTFVLNVDPVAEEPTVVANDVTGLEDTAIALDITVTTPETDGSDTITITISDLPDGFMASAGARTGTTVVLTPGQLSGLTITPLAGFSGAIPFTVVATAVDDGVTATGSDTFVFTVDPVAETPTLTANNVTGTEDVAVVLDITAAPSDADGSDVIRNVVLTGLPAGTTVPGADARMDGSFSVNMGNFGGVSVLLPSGRSGTVTVGVEAVAEDGTATASAVDSFDMVIAPVADPPVITADGATGLEETTFPLGLNVVTNPADPDGSESISSIVISGVPTGWALTNAMDDTGGNWNVNPADITSVGVLPPVDFVGTVSFGIEATTRDVADAVVDTTSESTSFSVTVTNANDAPVVEEQIADRSVNEDAGPVVIDLGAAFSDVDEAVGDELEYTVTAVVVVDPVNPIASSTAVGEILTINLGPDLNGRVNVTVTATDQGMATAEQTFELTVVPVDDPPSVPAPIADFSRPEDSPPVVINLPGRYADPDSINGDSVSITSATSGDTSLLTVVLVGESDITITFVPNAFGATSITILLEDTQGNSTEDVFTVTVVPVNDPPRLEVPLDDIVVAEDAGAQSTSLAFHFEDVDHSDASLIFTAGSSNSSLFSTFEVAAGVLNFTPADNQHGSATVSVMVQDPEGASITPPSETFTITVTQINDSPFVVTPIVEEVRVNEDAPPFTVSFAGVFDDPDLDTVDSETLTYTFTADDSVPVALDIAIAGEAVNITLIDNAHHEDLEPDGITDTFAEITVRATDSAGLSVEQTFKLYVNPEGDTPAAVDDMVTVEEDNGVEVMVLENDFAEDAPVTLTLADGSLDGPTDGTSVIINELGDEETVANGQVTVNPVAGTIGYLPRANFNGADSFGYTITDVDGETSTAVVTVLVNPANDPPVGSSFLSFTIVENTSLSLVAPGILQDASDVDGDDVDVDLLTLPVNGVLSINSEDGSLVYVPEVNFVGVDTFTYRVTDGASFNSDGDYSVEIIVTDAPPDPEPPPPGEVEFDFDLASTPLEEAVGAEANVLVVMDDSGSMDWSMMNPQPEGRFSLSSQGLTTAPAESTQTTFSYLLTLITNTYGSTSSSGRSLPAQATLDGDAEFDGNNYGVWRGRTSRYNTIYYDPTVEYKPWVGLDPNNVEYTNAIPTMAALDPTEFNPLLPTTFIDLTMPIDYVSDNVPAITGPSAQETCTDFGFFTFCFPPEGKDVTNTNYYIPRYYTSTAADPLAFNSPRTLVEIRDPNTDGDGNPLTSPPSFAGGLERTDCAEDDDDPTDCTLEQELQNFANWFVYYRSREYVAKAALGVVVSESFNLRIGYVTLNDANAREEIASMNASFRTGEKAELLDEVYDINSDGTTPLRTALDAAGRHFECLAGDSFGSTSGSSPGDAGCPVFVAPEGQCQSNFALLFTDGTWNGAGPAEDRDGPDPGDTPFDGGVFADGRAGTLADVAMHYYERDLHTLTNQVATSERDLLLAPESAFGIDAETMHQHMKTYTIGFGVDGLLTDDDIPDTFEDVLPMSFDWGDPFTNNDAKIDDLRHAALNGRGLYLAGNNSTLLAEAFRGAFNDFQRGSTSVSAVSLNSNELDTDTVRYRASFNLKLKTGEIAAFLLDSDGNAIEPALWLASEELDGKLPTNRVIITSSNNTLDGTDTGIPFRFAELDAFQLAVLSEDEVDYLRGVRTQERPVGVLRERPDEEGLLGDFVHSDPIFVGAPSALERDQAPFPTSDLYSTFATAQASRTAVLYTGSNDGMLHGFNALTGEELLAYIPNKLIDIRESFRNELSQITSPTYGHEFFVDLTPAISDVYMKQRPVGSQSWKTVLMGGYEAGGKGYFLLNVTSPSSFSEANADDILLWEFTDQDDTYPTDSMGVPLVDGDGDPLVDLAGDEVRDLGYSFSEVTLQMSNVNGASGEKEWMAVFGNGYNSTHGVAKLFVLFLDRGLDGWGDSGDFVKLDTGFGVQAAPHPSAGLPNGLGTPALIDQDANGTVDLAYAGDLLGNVYRFDLSDSNPANWTTTRLFTATYTDPVTSNEIPQPITQKPLVRKHPTEADGFLVVFGTGSYITENDGVSDDIQSVYGIWDRLITGAAPDTSAADAKSTKLVQQTMTKAVVAIGGEERTLRLLTSNDVDYSVGAGAARKFGWFFNLDVVRPANKADGSANDDNTGNAPPDPQFPGERAIRRFILRNDFVTTSTVVPREANTCVRAPPGSIINFDMAGGGNPNQPVLDLNNDGIVDDNDLVMIDGVEYAAGIEFSTDDLDGTLVDLTILGDADSDILFVSGGEDTEGIRITGTTDDKTGRLSWRELDDAN